MSETVTITLNKESHYNHLQPAIKTGELIRFTSRKKYKRFFLECIYGGYGEATLKTVYKPSPKSRLKYKTIFSKIKCKII